MKRNIGFSILSFFPHFFLPYGYNKISKILNATNIGIQLIPLRGLRKQHIEKFQVLSFEGPWNCGTLHDISFRNTFIRKDDNPSIIDIILFGSERNCRNRIDLLSKSCPDAVTIDVPWLQTSAIELSPEMYFGTARKWDQQKPNGIVLDTQHWIQFERGEAERRFEELGGMANLRMVHVKLLTLKDAVSFCKTIDTTVSLVREFLSSDVQEKIPVIIEAGYGAMQLGKTMTQSVERLSNRLCEVLS